MGHSHQEDILGSMPRRSVFLTWVLTSCHLVAPSLAGMTPSRIQPWDKTKGEYLLDMGLSAPFKRSSSLHLGYPAKEVCWESRQGGVIPWHGWPHWFIHHFMFFFVFVFSLLVWVTLLRRLSTGHVKGRCFLDVGTS